MRMLGVADHATNTSIHSRQVESDGVIVVISMII